MTIRATFQIGSVSVEDITFFHELAEKEGIKKNQLLREAMELLRKDRQRKAAKLENEKIA